MLLLFYGVSNTIDALYSSVGEKVLGGVVR